MLKKIIKTILKPIAILIISFVGIFLSVINYWKEINKKIDIKMAEKEAEKSKEDFIEA